MRSRGLCWDAPCRSFHHEEVSEGAIQGTGELQRCAAEGLCASLCTEGEAGGRSSAEGKGVGLWNVAALSVCSLSFVSGAAGHIEIPVLRQGPDLSTPTSVWCATRTSDPPSASPGVDYVPSSRKIEFRPGKTEEVRSHLDSC